MSGQLSSESLDIVLSDTDAKPLKDQLYDKILAKIRSGALKPGDRLPSSRLLSEHLHVARVTVTAAYARLSAEGFLASRIGSGTVVAQILPEKADSWKPTSVAGMRKSVSKRIDPALRAGDFRVQSLRPFAVSSPDFESLPGKKWTQIVARVSKSPWLHNGYCEPGGHPPFREAIADYVRRVRGLACDAEDVIVTTGIQQGLSMSAQILFNPGETVLVENPGYGPHRDALRYFGLQIEPVDVNEDGIDLSKLSGAGARGILVTPCHQYPLGRLMQPKSRSELLDWAATTGAWIIEDDYDGELRYDGAPYPALAALDVGRENVVYLGSFTKMIYPGFNLGYLIAPKGLAKAFEGAKLLNDRHASEVHQVILTEFISGGFYEAHIRHLKKLYETRRSAMIEAFEKSLSRYGRLIPSSQGTHLAFVLEINCSDVRLVEFLRAQMGLELRPLSSCYISGTPLRGLIVGFSGFTEDQIRSAVQLLSKGIERFLLKGRMR